MRVLWKSPNIYSCARRNSGEDSERQRRYSTERRSERSMEANRSSDRERARESNRSALVM